MLGEPGRPGQRGAQEPEPRRGLDDWQQGHLTGLLDEQADPPLDVLVQAEEVDPQVLAVVHRRRFDVGTQRLPLVVADDGVGLAHRGASRLATDQSGYQLHPQQPVDGPTQPGDDLVQYQ